jgi:hypothetical protein
MASTTTTVRNVNADVMEHYRSVAERGEKPADVAKRFGITGSTVSANVKRVRGYIDAGDTINVDGAVTGAAPDVPAVDPLAIAEALLPGGSIVASAVLTADHARDTARGKLDDQRKRLTEQLAQLDAKLPDIDKQHATTMERVQLASTGLGFDIDAWREAVTAANVEHAKLVAKSDKK